MEHVLEADGLGKRYGARWALRDCTLRLPAGRIAALVGPNGSGKTTLLHLAVGLQRPDAGAVRVFGETPYENTAALAEIGFVAQDTPLYRDFTADDLVIMGGKVNRRWDATLARTRLAQAGIPPRTPVGKLSGGQRAQVALALALAKRPRLLLLDEPVASLDPLARREFLQSLMGGVAESGTTVLLSSHILADLERSCDYLVVLQAGRVHLTGAVDDIVAAHRQLVGPRHDGGPVGGVAAVVRARHTDRQSTLVARVDGPVSDPAWTVHELSLEDLILAYLDSGDARANHEAWGVPA
ncbi:ABC transporter ATP-binding protein [Dactylosporangium aurantiacum]|uniref:ABC transporter ATP-binding protein n=1 Tax=Dactylosporangium aurantiacum TaxID=35754 RepID=A0A9Q9MSN9_9ACTN|nr:ABC transporter ATP-binding protein [Dactylosporangium aurantiacum]MDG6106154.1 ABC transporter ATP-binding protein [Dactylosporangium aurantiacum]UWZ59652.1 ABC transporter ATP-binding protein [Dactylosporangium aurantiacum]